MNTPTTELGNDVRAEVARILQNYTGKQYAIAPVKVSTLRAIDKLLNPEPETFQIPVERANAAPYEAMSNARLDRMRAADAGMGMR